MKESIRLKSKQNNKPSVTRIHVKGEILGYMKINYSKNKLFDETL